MYWNVLFIDLLSVYQEILGPFSLWVRGDQYRIDATFQIIN